ncbi:Msx2-interacting protein SMART/HDAC1-associated repressor protein SPEN -like protein [Triplophysa tibetana]|uniref:Msx2-interacting protein n=1 Tax=Triplophysa tibetana TaxID=1572043 RepID=A0A5A9NNN2_9TELE|nr:Msx2-interacting protein SMART/HDAC1-associated repressor protein SPEN -like protein [Triplophysa tibetana]
MASAVPQKRVVSSVFITLASPFRATLTPTTPVHSSPVRDPQPAVPPLRSSSASSQDGTIMSPLYARSRPPTTLTQSKPTAVPYRLDDTDRRSADGNKTQDEMCVYCEDDFINDSYNLLAVVINDPPVAPPPDDLHEPCDPRNPRQPDAPAEACAGSDLKHPSSSSSSRGSQDSDVCGFCRKPVLLSEPAIDALNRSYHAACFQCRQCHAPLAAKLYYNSSGIPLCEDCYQCSACGQMIIPRVDGTDSYTVACLGHSYHEDCYRCQISPSRSEIKRRESAYVHERDTDDAGWFGKPDTSGYGRVESVKVLRKRGSEGGVAAFVDFVDIKSAQKAHNAVNKMGDRDLRTDYNEPGSVPSAVRGLEDSSPSSSHGREVAGFSRGSAGPVYGPPVSLHTREGRYERRLDGSSDSRERAYEHSPYGHHERGGSFDRPRHYNTDYYRDRSMFASAVSSSPGASSISGGFDTPESHFESRIRDPFTLSSSARRDTYREDRGRRADRTYHHRRSRSSHSSQSRHPSPQRSTGQTPKAPPSPKRTPVSPGRGPRSRSRSQSSSSDSVSSTSSTGSGSSDSNSSSSEGSRARSVQSAATHAPPPPPTLALDPDEPRRSFGIRVQNLPTRSTDTSLKDGLFHEFKKYGKVTSVQIHGALEERYGLVFFRQQEDQEKALGVSKGKLFFGMQIEVTAWNGPETESENEFRPLDGRIDEFHPKATRTLFIGNLEKTTNYQQLLDVFQRFGEIVDIDIKRVNGVPQYAFVQYSDIASVCKAIKKMDGEYLGSNRLKCHVMLQLGFGKSMPTACVWLDGLTSNITEQYLTRHFCRYGPVVKAVFDRLKGMALILYNNADFAQAAVRETKGWKIGGNKIKVLLKKISRDLPIDERRASYHDFAAERAYYENVRTPGIYTEDPRREYSGRSRDRYAELDHYQGDHYDPRYNEDPREYRDYRDPFEDIRKYSYIQRERERERERFEADRSRWSPSHPRRTISPSASPSPSDRVSRDAERRVYRHSSERSGSCSSLSPPPPPPSQFEKTEKSPVDFKEEEPERELEQTEAERVSATDNRKRGRRKEKAEREKGEKAKQRRGKVQSPSASHAEADKEACPDLSGKVKVSDVEREERPKHKGDNELSPSDSVTRVEPQKGERLDQGKSESLDRDGKGKTKKHFKAESGSDGKDTLFDSSRLEARKRRFGDPSGKAVRHKKGRLDEDPGSSDFGPNPGFAKETDADVKTEKEAQKREHSKVKMTSHYSHREELDSSLRGTSQGPLVHPGESSEVEPIDSKSHPGQSLSRRTSNDVTSEKDQKARDEYLDNIDLSQSYRKQMEQNRRLRQQLQEPDKLGKSETVGLDAEDLDHRSLVHEVGKPPEDVTDNSSPIKSKKQEVFELDMSAKRERIYRTFRQKSEDPEWNNTNSPRFQHAPQQREEEYIDAHSQLIAKEPSRPDDNVQPDPELPDKPMHAPQMSKISISQQDEQQRRWETRLKQDLLPDFSRSSEKRRLNPKFLDYGLWPDLEPGEVRSDSEEDRENKPNSPLPSTSVSFTGRHRTDRLTETKPTFPLERNKFRSFADDQAITPDTKALLERAKSLSSSREDNWSFLDCDSHFASLRSRKDTEKVEAAPRPTPSWYLKKKKIRSESDDKLDERKVDPKPEEQERRELFASRFLHSSIFEQDSRRLQHLERKHEEPEQHGVGCLYSQQGSAEGQPETEPVVLFHSRFLEFTRLQQQKTKEQSHQVFKQGESTEETKLDKIEEEELEAHQQNATEANVIHQTEVKSIVPVHAPEPSPVQAPLTFPHLVAHRESLLTVEMEIADVASHILPEPTVKEEPQEPEEPSAQPPHHLIEQNIESNSSDCPKAKTPVDEIKSSPKTDEVDNGHEEVKEQLTNDDETPKVELSLKLPEPLNPSPLQVPAEEPETELVQSAVEAEPNSADEQKRTEHCAVEEAVSPPPKSRTKKGKTSPTVPTAAAILPATPDKQSTRKSERIDKEKLKRSSSPRGEVSKAMPDSRSLNKSPVHSLDLEHGTEQASLPVRARRRNVRSVYATPIEDETAPQPVKDAESPRVARKRGADKDAGSDAAENLVAPTTSKRGRPPKNRRHAEDALVGRVERSKSTETKEFDSTDEAVSKVGKGKHSPHAQKGLSPVNVSLASGLEKMSESSKLISEESSLFLKNLRIQLDVTEVKAMLQTSEDEPVRIDDSVKKSSPGVSSKEQLQETTFESDVIDAAVKSEKVASPVLSKATEPQGPLLSRELELEQAVENIAKLTDDSSPLPFKSTPAKAQRPVVGLAEEPQRDLEEKPANPSSETELAAAIDSITSETTPCSVPQEQIIRSVVDSNPNSKVAEPCVKTAGVQEEPTATTPKKGCKGRAKASKRPRGQKAAGGKKEPIKDAVLDAESISVKLPEGIPAELPTLTERSLASTTVVITSSSKPSASLTAPNSDPEVPLKTESDIPKSSLAISRSPSSSRNQPYSYDSSSPSLSPTRICLGKNLSPHPSRLSVSPTDRCIPANEAAVISPPLTSLAPLESPTLPTDTSVLDANPGDVRKILPKPRAVPLPENPSSGNIHAPPVREIEMTPDVITNKSAAQDNRQASVTAPPVVRQPASIPSPETKQIFSEKSVISVIASTPTSVISRVCNPSDSEEKPNAPIGNPFLDKQPPKQIYQPSLAESSTYHGPAVGEEGGNASRYIVESTSLSTGSSAGLRVQTSEGVVVLSHSGQKMEGPLRISAKISQIPPASAVDIESQQLGSMPQIKQELYSASQPPASKSVPSDHGHSIKPQLNLSIKQESALDKLESPYTPVQSGVVKRLQQTAGPSQVMGYHHAEYPMVMKHPKKGDESLSVDERVKPAWVQTISPALTPHLPSAAGNHVGFMSGTSTDRAPSLIQSKQEPRSPRKSGHPHSPFAKVSSPIGSSSPKGVSLVLPSGLPSLPQYVHHSEQSVIMPPHNAHGSIGRMSPHRVGPIGHLTQGEVRVNTPPLSMMNYGIHSESLGSSWPPGQQRPTSPQAVGNREMVLKVNPANARSLDGGEDEARRFHPTLGRPPAAQLKAESIPAEYRGGLHSGLPLDRFNIAPRDMRVLMHHQQSDRPAAELHQGHMPPENQPASSTPTSMAASLSPRPQMLSKGVSEKDAAKISELKRAASPSTKEGMMAIRGAMPPKASPQRVQLMAAGGGASFNEYSPVYTNLRPAHSQFPDSSSLGISVPPSQGVQEPESSQSQAEAKEEPGGHQPVNMVQLLNKYPIVWQGLLALKNDTAAVQLHFLCGNKALGLRSLPVPESGGILRIVQRMRLEAQQLEGVTRRMTEDVLNQTQALKSAFINYLQAKLAAGIINVPNPGSNQIFPPCEFSEGHLSRLAPDLLSQISSISPHLMIVITSV